MAHNWETVGEDTNGVVLWCAICGSLKLSNPTELRTVVGYDESICAEEEFYEKIKQGPYRPSFNAGD